MTKIKVQDAARQLGAGAKELMDRISGTRKGTQDTLGALRKLEERLSAKEAQAREEAERVRAEQERIQEEQDRIDAAKAQDEALRAAVLAERARREAAPTAENQENTQEPAKAEAPKAEAPKAEAPKAEAAQPAARPQQPTRLQQGNRPQGDRRPQRPGAFTPRPFVPNPNDPNALVNRQNPNFVPPQGAQQGERRPYAPRDGQQGDRRPYPPRDGERRPYAPRDGQQGDRRPYPPRDGGRPFTPKDKDSDAPQQRRPAPRNGGFSRPKAPELTPVMEKERVSNYDPNKNNYQRQHDPEKKAQKPKKQIMKENVRAAGGLDDEWRRSKKPKKGQQTQPRPEPVKIEKAYMTAEKITVKDLTERIGKPAGEIIKKLLLLGIMATINKALDIDTASVVAAEFGYEVEKVGFAEEQYLADHRTEDSPEQLKRRPPVVTIMGHVDHGKTSLLDAIRKTNVTSGEAGGITQHIGAYHVKTKRGEIVFLDTPGHEAFTAMRARGAQVTDLVVLVVAADDGVMEQTREAVNHSRAAGVPIMVAVNKMDKPTANPDRVLQELASLGLVPEDWGGDTVVCKVSAKTREGLDEMLEMLALQADILELTANPDKPARGHIVEAKLDKGRGPVATVLIQEGTLHQGDTFVCGVFSGRVRAMFNDQGRKVKEAGPSIPVEVQGFEGVPEAGEEFICLEDEKLARRIAESRAVKLRERELAKQSRVTLETFLSRKADDQEALVLNLVVKSDVQGSLEAIVDALNKQSTEKVRINIIHGGTGAITESDILLASASDAIIIGFNVRPTAKVKEMAEHESVDIRFYDIIYKLVDEIKSAMAGLLAPVSREVYLGQAEVREVFSVPKVGSIAGSHVVDGKLTRNASVRLLRDGVVVHNGKIASLRRFKDDVREVLKGYECGISLENFNDIKVGDVIEAFEMVEEAATL